MSWNPQQEDKIVAALAVLANKAGIGEGSFDVDSVTPLSVDVVTDAIHDAHRKEAQRKEATAAEKEDESAEDADERAEDGHPIDGATPTVGTPSGAPVTPSGAPVAPGTPPAGAWPANTPAASPTAPTAPAAPAPSWPAGGNSPA